MTTALDLIHKDTKEKILQNIDINKIIENKMFHIFSCFKYKIEGEYNYIHSKNYVNNIVSKILNNEQNINELFKNQILKYLKKKK